MTLFDKLCDFSRALWASWFVPNTIRLQFDRLWTELVGELRRYELDKLCLQRVERHLQEARAETEDVRQQVGTFRAQVENLRKELDKQLTLRETDEAELASLQTEVGRLTAICRAREEEVRLLREKTNQQLAESADHLLQQEHEWERRKQAVAAILFSQERLTVAPLDPPPPPPVEDPGDVYCDGNLGGLGTSSTQNRGVFTVGDPPRYDVASHPAFGMPQEGY